MRYLCDIRDLRFARRHGPPGRRHRHPTAQAPSHRLEILRARLAALGIRHEIERDLLPFGEVAHAGALDRADVDEHVLAAVGGLDEAVASLRIEELDGTRGHDSLPRRSRALAPARATIARPRSEFSDVLRNPGWARARQAKARMRALYRVWRGIAKDAPPGS